MVDVHLVDGVGHVDLGDLAALGRSALEQADGGLQDMGVLRHQHGGERLLAVDQLLQVHHPGEVVVVAVGAEALAEVDASLTGVGVVLFQQSLHRHLRFGHMSQLGGGVGVERLAQSLEVTVSVRAFQRSQRQAQAVDVLLAHHLGAVDHAVFGCVAAVGRVRVPHVVDLAGCGALAVTADQVVGHDLSIDRLNLLVEALEEGLAPLAALHDFEHRLASGTRLFQLTLVESLEHGQSLLAVRDYAEHPAHQGLDLLEESRRFLRDAQHARCPELVGIGHALLRVALHVSQRLGAVTQHVLQAGVDLRLAHGLLHHGLDRLVTLGVEHGVEEPVHRLVVRQLHDLQWVRRADPRQMFQSVVVCAVGHVREGVLQQHPYLVAQRALEVCDGCGDLDVLRWGGSGLG